MERVDGSLRLLEGHFCADLQVFSSDVQLSVELSEACWKASGFFHCSVHSKTKTKQWKKSLFSYQETRESVYYKNVVMSTVAETADCCAAFNVTHK